MVLPTPGAELNSVVRTALAQYGASGPSRILREKVSNGQVVKSASMVADTRQHLTVRLSPADRKRIRAFSVDIGVSVQSMIVAGFNRTLAEHGLPPLDDATMMPPPPKKKRAKTSGASP